jgi:MbtH protein
VSNPFEDEIREYVVLLNAEQQYSLWPEFAGVPGGWWVVIGPDSRAACLAHIERNWLDLRPKSLVALTTGD